MPPTSVVRSSIGRNCDIGDDTKIAEHTTIDDDTRIGPKTQIGADAKIGQKCRIDADAKIGHQANVGDHGAIGEGGTLRDRAELGSESRLNSDVERGEDSVLGEDAKVGKGCVIGYGSVIGRSVQIDDNVELGPQARLERDTVIGAHVIAGHEVTIGERAFVGMGSTIGTAARIADNVHCEPNSEVPDDAIIHKGQRVKSRPQVEQPTTHSGAGSTTDERALAEPAGSTGRRPEENVSNELWSWPNQVDGTRSTLMRIKEEAVTLTGARAPEGVAHEAQESTSANYAEMLKAGTAPCQALSNGTDVLPRAKTGQRLELHQQLALQSRGQWHRTEQGDYRGATQTDLDHPAMDIRAISPVPAAKGDDPSQVAVILTTGDPQLSNRERAAWKHETDAARNNTPTNREDNRTPSTRERLAALEQVIEDLNVQTISVTTEHDLTVNSDGSKAMVPRSAAEGGEMATKERVHAVATATVRQQQAATNPDPTKDELAVECLAGAWVAERVCQSAGCGTGPAQCYRTLNHAGEVIKQEPERFQEAIQMAIKAETQVCRPPMVLQKTVVRDPADWNARDKAQNDDDQPDRQKGSRSSTTIEAKAPKGYITGSKQKPLEVGGDRKVPTAPTRKPEHDTQGGRPQRRPKRETYGPSM